MWQEIYIFVLQKPFGKRWKVIPCLSEPVEILIVILPGFPDDELSNYNEQQQRIAGEEFNSKCQRKNNRTIKSNICDKKSS